MAPITTIVHFEVPAANADRFLAYWHDHIRAAVSKQPGLVDGIFHRGTDLDGPFQFINVAHWDSVEQLAAGLAATNEQLPEMAGIFRDLGVTLSQNNYIEVAHYHATPAAAQPQSEL